MSSPSAKAGLEEPRNLAVLDRTEELEDVQSLGRLDLLAVAQKYFDVAGLQRIGIGNRLAVVERVDAVALAVGDGLDEFRNPVGFLEYALAVLVGRKVPPTLLDLALAGKLDEPQPAYLVRGRELVGLIRDDGAAVIGKRKVGAGQFVLR